MWYVATAIMRNYPAPIPYSARARPRALRPQIVRWAFSGVVLLALGCTKSAGKGPESPTSILSMEEALAVVRAERGELGLAEDQAAAPSSLAEVMTVMRHDQSERFAKTRDYLVTLPGVDALALRATLEMLWAEGQLTVADLAREHAKQKDADLRSLEDTLKLQPNDQALQARIVEAKRAADRERKLRDALETLAQPHYDLGMNLGGEVTRRNPERADGYTVLANLYRLRGEWSDFELNMQKAQTRAPERTGQLYARALERASRLGDRVGAREGLVALMGEAPDLARAQAQLVLLQDDVEARYEQLQKLKAINPTHALVVLEGQLIEREYATARELRAAEVKPAAQPATLETPAQ